MGIMVYSLLWVMQDFYHQPYAPSHPIHPVRQAIEAPLKGTWLRVSGLGFITV